MNIEFVNPVNLELLEDAFNSGIMNTKDITKDFGKNLPILLSHIKISFVISEISNQEGDFPEYHAQIYDFKSRML